MSTKIHCDICNETPARKVTFIVGRQRDPSGNSYEDTEEYHDLCFFHMDVVLARAIKLLEHENNQKLCSYVKERRRYVEKKQKAQTGSAR